MFNAVNKLNGKKLFLYCTCQTKVYFIYYFHICSILAEGLSSIIDDIGQNRPMDMEDSDSIKEIPVVSPETINEEESSSITDDPHFNKEIPVVSPERVNEQKSVHQLHNLRFLDLLHD